MRPSLEPCHRDGNPGRSPDTLAPPLHRRPVLREAGAAIEALRQIQPKVFAVAVTGLPSEIIRAYALAKGLDRFVFKPYRATDVIAMIP
jgi:hypothetical protein